MEYIRPPAKRGRPTAGHRSMSAPLYVRLDLETYDELYHESRRRGISMPELVRQMIAVDRQSWLPPIPIPPPGYRWLPSLSEKTLIEAEKLVSRRTPQRCTTAPPPRI